MKTIINQVIENLEIVKNNIDDETFYPTPIREAILDLGSLSRALLLAVIENKENKENKDTTKQKPRWC